MGDSELEALKKLLISNERYAGWCTIAVFAGLLIEYTILLWPKWGELKYWEKTFTVLAGIAIAGGVFGEYHFGSAAADDAIKLERISEDRVAKLNKEAGDAELKAAELEAKVADRHITVEQRKEMLAILTLGRRTPIAIGYLTDSGADASQYSLELAEVFCDAKWVVFRPIALTSTNSPIRGFLLDVQTEVSPASSAPGVVPPSKKLVRAIRDALAITGYDTLVQPPSLGYSLGGNIPSCKTPPPSAGMPLWYPTALEILVGNK